MKKSPSLEMRAALLIVRDEKPHPLIGIAFPEKASQRNEFSLTTPTEPIIDRFDCEDAVRRMMSAHFGYPPLRVDKLLITDPDRASTRRKAYHWYLVVVPSGCKCTNLAGFESFAWVTPPLLDHAISHMHDTRQRMLLLAFEVASKITPNLFVTYQSVLANLRGAVFNPGALQLLEQRVTRMA